MTGRKDQADPTDDEDHCGRCQHSVDVRGMEEVVCLAHLDVRQPTRGTVCDEFEHKRQSRLKRTVGE